MVWTRPRVSGATEPEGFNPDERFADRVALLEYREHLAFEKNVKVEGAKVSGRLRCHGMRCIALSTAGVHSGRPVSHLVDFAQVLRNKLRECYMKEGVNHYQNCREVPPPSRGSTHF